MQKFTPKTRQHLNLKELGLLSSKDIFAIFEYRIPIGDTLKGISANEVNKVGGKGKRGGGSRKSWVHKSAAFKAFFNKVKEIVSSTHKNHPDEKNFRSLANSSCGVQVTILAVRRGVKVKDQSRYAKTGGDVDNYIKTTVDAVYNVYKEEFKLDLNDSQNDDLRVVKVELPLDKPASDGYIVVTLQFAR
jgi:Holliday junction resolvase RusA-like endonuclease